MEAFGKGSPAHAGIDPDANTVGTVEDGFPRTRGDRPPDKRTVQHDSVVPPHTRG